MNEPCPCNDAAFISSVNGYQALPHLLRLLARNEPVDLDDFVDAAGNAGAEFARLVRAEPGSEWDEEGRLVGFGLTPNPTDYRFLVGERTFYTWCASDTLSFTIILGEDAVVESVCPATGAPIRLEVTPTSVTSVSPSEAVVSQRHRPDLVTNLRTDVCDHGHFFASADVAESWLAEHPDGEVLSVKSAFEQSRATCAELGWTIEERTR